MRGKNINFTYESCLFICEVNATFLYGSLSQFYFNQEVRMRMRMRRTMGKINNVFEVWFLHNLNWWFCTWATFYRNTTPGVYPHQTPSRRRAQPIIGKRQEIMCCPSPVQHKNVSCLYCSLFSNRLSSQNAIWIGFLDGFKRSF